MSVDVSDWASKSKLPKVAWERLRRVYSLRPEEAPSRRRKLQEVKVPLTPEEQQAKAEAKEAQILITGALEWEKH